MSDIHIRVAGKAGRITLARPHALNALTYSMMTAIEEAIDAWREDESVAVIVIDAEGDKAFCAGGDIADLYNAGKAGDFAFGRQFWRDEYRLNAKLAEYPKPIVTLLQGFTMGGGVGIGCHASHRVVGETSQIAMPECGIGLIPDVGGSLILARAPGATGESLALTGARMGAADAIFVGFADHFVPQSDWPDLVTALEKDGDPAAVEQACSTVGQPELAAQQADISSFFARSDLAEILTQLDGSDTTFAAKARKAVLRNAPLSMACALELLERVRRDPTIRTALTEEYRFTWRASEMGDFLEGIRAQIIDKDRNPRWRHGPTSVTPDHVAAMMAPLGENDLNWETAS